MDGGKSPCTENENNSDCETKNATAAEGDSKIETSFPKKNQQQKRR